MNITPNKETVYRDVRVPVEIKHERCYLQHANMDIQMRLEGDGRVYISASNEFDWQDKIVAATLPFEVFHAEFRKFCAAMRAMEKYPAKGGDAT